MNLKCCMVISIIVCLIMGSMSGCSSKGESDQISQKEQTKESNLTEETGNENEDIQKDEALQLTIVAEDYEEVFQSLQGCAVILDSEKNIYTFYNEDKCRTRVSPNSTFKIISALTGLHNQVVTAEDSKMGYNGINYPIDTWNADLSLAEAFRSSCIWYFRKVIDEVGQETVQEELEELDYGNCDISEWSGGDVNVFSELNGFWIESSLLISPIEQVEVLRNIMEGKSIYTESEVEILKSIMLLEESGSQKIYGKTGTGTNNTAWFIGFVENKETNIYFAVYLDDSISTEINGAKAQEIALNILRERS